MSQTEYTDEESELVYPAARDLLEWNGVLPDLRIIEEEHGATATFMIVADYGWAERILCGGCYEGDAQTILVALDEAKR